MISRWQQKGVESLLRYFRVVNLTGARQCGKTTLAGMLSLPKVKRFTLDDDEIRKSAASDPYGFVERHEEETGCNNNIAFSDADNNSDMYRRCCLA